MDASAWLAMPHQVRRQVATWQADPATARLLAVESLPQYTGESVFALTITDPDVPRGAKRALWCCVPHAHEPAGTAACMDVAHQLLTGHDLRGRPTPYDVPALLRRVVVTLNPDANPGGRCWAPVLWWDGSRYSNEELWQWMRGVDPETGGMWQRLARWSLRERSPLRRGIVYEQLNAHQFVEPNRDPGSSLVRLFRRLDARYRFDRSLHLHQTEFVGSDRNCFAGLPVRYAELPPAMQGRNRAWAEAIIRAWTALGPEVAAPRPEPRGFSYPDDPQTVAWFTACWGDAQERMPDLLVEVQNNSPRTPPEHQLRLAATALWCSIEGAAAEAP
jgi:hypothetical protein